MTDWATIRKDGRLAKVVEDRVCIDGEEAIILLLLSEASPSAGTGAIIDIAVALVRSRRIDAEVEELLPVAKAMGRMIVICWCVFVRVTA